MENNRSLKEWKIVLEPDGEGETINVCYMPVGADEQDAITDAKGYAELIEAYGGVGKWAIGVAYFVPGAVMRSYKRSWRVRLDCWERETDNGWSVGYGWLRVREIFA